MCLINKDEAKEVLKKLLYETAINNKGDFSEMCVDIANDRLDTWLGLVPTADAVPVKYGYWVEIKELNGGEETPAAMCSECNESLLLDDYWSIDEVRSEFKYCPYCGARMLEVEDEDATD